MVASPVTATFSPNPRYIPRSFDEATVTDLDQVEALTGYDFFSNVPVSIQAVIEAQVDNQ